MKKVKVLSLFVVLTMAIVVVAGCAPAAQAPAEAPKAEEPAAEAPAAEAPAAEAPAKKLVFGLSNAWIGSEWRSQMLANFEQACKELGIETVVEHADTDVPGQIAQINNLIAKGVDALIINPADIAALKPVIAEANAQGIVVIIIDAEIPGDDHVNVVINQKEWASISMRWLVEKLGGKGNIVTIEGYLGHPANEFRMEGVAEVLAANPGIKLVGEDTGKWDPATAQKVAANFIAANPGLNGIWTQDGMAEGTCWQYRRLVSHMRIGRKLFAKPAEAVCAPGRKSLMNILILIASQSSILRVVPMMAVYVAYNLVHG